MLLKLQRRTLVLSQIIGYVFTLLIGATIIFTTSQFYLDIKPLLSQQTDVFNKKSAVISKNISLFKTMNKEKIYFTNQEIYDIKSMSFVKDISKINRATFNVSATSGDPNNQNIPIFTTDLFFESVPDKYLDVSSEKWSWESTSNFIPIIIPKDFLNLYNFGFAESQGLPVLSENTIGQLEFNLKISGNGKIKYYKSGVVGFTDKFNSVLVPEAFLHWANDEYGSISEDKTSRILLEFNDPTDKSILKYFNENDYSINKSKLEFNKLVFIFKTALVLVLFIAIVIIILSVAFIMLSFNLIIQRNKKTLINLYSIGYSYRQISKFYQILISATTLFSIAISVVISDFIRHYYLEKIIDLFDFLPSKNYILLFGLALVLVLISVYNVRVVKGIKKVVLAND